MVNLDEDVEASSPLLGGLPNQPPYNSPSFRKRLQENGFIILLLLLLAVVLVLLYGSTTGNRDLSFSDSNFPSFIGYEGPTPTGSEPLAAATAYAQHKDVSPLQTDSETMHKFGNLAPWKSVDHGLGTSPNIPEECSISQVHLLHRHGARYPTLGSGTVRVSDKLANSTGWKASGPLSFLHDYSYQLGAEILTPFGREQLFGLGAGMRVKYGKLLDNEGDEERSKPVFRTESQDRMLKSALNFAAGYFGIPYEDQYHQLITIEAPGFNNTLAPYMTCPNSWQADLNLGPEKTREWIGIYLAPALVRLQADIEGLELTLGDLYSFQLLCAYETVALGGSKFCDLFTDEEWDGFEYSVDLQFWYSYSFGHPTQAAVGLGWVQEWLARVTETPITVFNSSTNSSYHTPEYFPLGKQNIYVDATHDTVISAVITSLNFSSFTKTGPLPSTHIPKNRSFNTADISPFASNLQAQIITCPSRWTSSPDDARFDHKFVRWILNDGIVPLDGIEGCGEDEEGLCDLETFVRSTNEFANSIDWARDCLSSYSLGDTPITNGRPNYVDL